jgi:hypothetical protein
MKKDVEVTGETRVMVLFQILNTTPKYFPATGTKEHRTVLVRDIRGTESGYSLDTHGFEVFTLLKKDGDSPNNDTGDSEYFDEVSDMIKAAFVSHLSDLLHAKVENTSTGAKNVIIFAKVIRRLRRDALKAREFEGAKVQAPSQDLMWILRKTMPSYRPAEWFPEELIWSEILLAGSFSESGG